MTNVWSLSGMRAIITGATKGIGRAISDEFVSLGAEVLLVARTAAELREQAAAYNQDGAHAHWIDADVATEDGRNRVLAAARTHFEAVEVLVNNAGTNIRKATTAYTAEDLTSLYVMNVESAYLLSTGLFPLLCAAQGSSIINVASIAGQRVIRLTTAPYSMTKAAMEQMTNYLAVEWADKGIRVNSVHPWYIKTPLAEPVLADPEKRARIEGATPLGRAGEPDEVARVVAFLAMPAASYLSGVNLPIDGGLGVVGVK